jgi:hypothetical protein
VSVRLAYVCRAVVGIHAEEDILGWSTSDFTVVVENRRALAPFYTLWHTFKELELKHPRWTKNVFALDADVVAADSERIWRAMAKLVKTLRVTAPATVRVAEAALSKVCPARWLFLHCTLCGCGPCSPPFSHLAPLVALHLEQVEGFRKHIGLLQVVCNKGMKERHWNQVYAIVGFHVRPETPTELSTVGMHGRFPPAPPPPPTSLRHPSHAKPSASSGCHAFALTPSFRIPLFLLFLLHLFIIAPLTTSC